SAYAPRMQRTLLELGFMPAAYVPAMVFHQVERLDAVKMVRLLVPADLGEIFLSESAQKIKDIVMKAFQMKEVVPQVASAVSSLSLFCGLNEEQVNRLARLCHLEAFAEKEIVFAKGEGADKMFVVLHGSVDIQVEGKRIGSVGAGDCLGEVALLNGVLHSADAQARESTIMAVLTIDSLNSLVRMRPDIGVLIYKNLAIGLGKKLNISARESVG
ncbi:MAG: cyclic nucleotide-binding domain-containing protein, partial [Candidatus Obscuribacterales bacterium]|nr:cyclic nucleotide-binding domain-containing protein [Candidatus Obscuribacterales bacterium]